MQIAAPDGSGTGIILTGTVIGHLPSWLVLEKYKHFQGTVRHGASLAQHKLARIPGGKVLYLNSTERRSDLERWYYYWSSRPVKISVM